MANGAMIWQTGMGYIYIVGAQNTKESGRMIYKTGKGQKTGLIMQDMKGFIKMGKKMAKEPFILQIKVSIKESFLKMKSRGMGSIIGQMEKLTRAFG